MSNAYFLMNAIEKDIFPVLIVTDKKLYDENPRHALYVPAKDFKKQDITKVLEKSASKLMKWKPSNPSLFVQLAPAYALVDVNADVFGLLFLDKEMYDESIKRAPEKAHASVYVKNFAGLVRAYKNIATKKGIVALLPLKQKP